MRYEDASQSGSSNNENPVARDDADALAAGARGPATGNVITGAGTQTGSLGADLGADDAQIVSISGAQRQRLQLRRRQACRRRRVRPPQRRCRGQLYLPRQQGRAGKFARPLHLQARRRAGQQRQRHADHRNRQVAGRGPGQCPAGRARPRRRRRASRRRRAERRPGRRPQPRHRPARRPPDGDHRRRGVRAAAGARRRRSSRDQPCRLADRLRNPPRRGRRAGRPQSSGGNFEVPVGPLDPGVDAWRPHPADRTRLCPARIPRSRVRSTTTTSREILIQTPDQPAGVENATAQRQRKRASRARRRAGRLEQRLDRRNHDRHDRLSTRTTRPTSITDRRRRRHRRRPGHRRHLWQSDHHQHRQRRDRLQLHAGRQYVGDATQRPVHRRHHRPRRRPATRRR